MVLLGRDAIVLQLQQQINENEDHVNKLKLILQSQNQVLSDMMGKVTSSQERIGQIESIQDSIVRLVKFNKDRKLLGSIENLDEDSCPSLMNSPFKLANGNCKNNLNVNNNCNCNNINSNCNNCNNINSNCNNCNTCNNISINGNKNSNINDNQDNNDKMKSNNIRWFLHALGILSSDLILKLTNFHSLSSALFLLITGQSNKRIKRFEILFRLFNAIIFYHFTRKQIYKFIKYKKP